MKQSRKITYAAVCTAIAAVCIILSRYLPIRLMPLMAASLCFFVAFKCGFGYGIATMTASMLFTLFWGTVDITVLLVLLFFAPYSIAAFFMRRLKYKKPSEAAFRAGVTTVLFNIALALIVFVFLQFVGELFFGIDFALLADKLGGKAVAYVILAVFGSIFMIGFDIMFVMAEEVIGKKLKLP